MDKFIEVDGKKISYSDIGNGPTIVFLHGWLDSKKVFDNLTSILFSKYRCVSIDLPGFGESDVIKDVTLIKMSQIINKVIKKIGISHFDLVGHSMGGAITLVYASRYQEKIKKVVLISPFVTFKQFSKSVFYFISNFFPFLITKLMSLKKPNLKVVNAFRVAYLLSNVDLYKYLRKVRKDILVVYGRRDALLSIRPLEPLFGVLNNIHLAIFEDVRHYIFSYNSEDLANKIDLFFQKNNTYN